MGATRSRPPDLAYQLEPLPRPRQRLYRRAAPCPAGKANPDRTQVDDPSRCRPIKNVGHYFGADIVGIGRTRPCCTRAAPCATQLIVDAEEGPSEGPAELCRKYPYVIVTPVAWDYDLAQAHRHHIGDAAYDTTLMQTVLVLTALESYIRELGYTALRGKVNPQAAALAGGVGELGSNGLIISEKFGARIHLSDAILTDLPLAPDGPIDLGVEDFSQICRRCAEDVPHQQHQLRAQQAGLQRRREVQDQVGNLLQAAPAGDQPLADLPDVLDGVSYTKPNTWWRTLALQTLRTTPKRLGRASSAR